MGFLSYGSAKGLSYQHDFNKDMDRLYKREAYRSQVQAQKEQKTKYYADLMKQHTAASPWATKQLEGMYEKLNKEIADYAIENPGFETDVTKMQKFLSMTDKYLNNDIVRKDIQSQQQFEKLKAAYNGGNLRQDVYEKEMERYTDWMQNGGDGYVFANVKLPTFDQIVTQAGKTLQPDTYIKDENGMIKNVTKTDPEAIFTQAQIDYADPDKRPAIDKQYEEIQKNPELDTYDSALDMYHKILEMNETEKEAFRAYNLESQYNLARRKKSLTGGGSDLSPANTYFNKNILANYKVGKTINVPHLVAFTPFHEKGKTIALNGNEFESRVFNKRKGENGKWEQFELKGRFKELNTKEIKIMNDGAYTLIDVETFPDPVKDENYIEQLLAAGFTLKQNNEEAMIKVPNSTADRSKFPSYTGSVLVKANINQGTIQEYEKSAGGLTRANKFSDTQSYKQLEGEIKRKDRRSNWIMNANSKLDDSRFGKFSLWIAHPDDNDLVYRYENVYDNKNKLIGKRQVAKNIVTGQDFILKDDTTK